MLLYSMPHAQPEELVPRLTVRWLVTVIGDMIMSRMRVHRYPCVPLYSDMGA